MRKDYKDLLDKMESPHQKFVREVEESKRLADEDKKSLCKEKDEEIKHKSFLAKFRDENKMVSNEKHDITSAEPIYLLL